MATFRDVVDIANSEEHQAGVEYRMIEAATAVMAEEAITENHAERVVYAKAILAGEARIKEYAKAVATNPAIYDKMIAAQDYSGDLAFVVNSFFNAFAGIST